MNKEKIQPGDIVEFLADQNLEHWRYISVKKGDRFRVISVHEMKKCPGSDQLEIQIGTDESAFILSYKVFLYYRFNSKQNENL